MKELKKQLQALPKGDVHNHLHLSAGVELLKEHYPDVHFKIPGSYDGFDGMMRFIIQHVNTLMRSSEDVVMLMDMAIRSGINDNVTHLEASVDMGLTKYFDNSMDALIRAVGGLKEKYKQEIEFRPEIGIKKDSALEEVYGDGIACIESDVFDGIDLYGKETEQDLSGFKDIFQRAKALSKKTKIHIGEFSDSRSVINAIETLGPDEIQHGIHTADSEEAIQLVRDRKIRLNICPQSNVALGATSSLKEHPIRKLYDAGVIITINTDDLLLFNATITEQFADLIQQGIFTFEEIEEIRQNALQGS
ncbi:MAG: adenosine deaminase [Eudoraea sp.]|nr:adenosine deaminase [Eudoraea sp.]